jgi:hypothetical protein
MKRRAGLKDAIGSAAVLLAIAVSLGGAIIVIIGPI